MSEMFLGGRRPSLARDPAGTAARARVAYLGRVVEREARKHEPDSRLAAQRLPALDDVRHPDRYDAVARRLRQPIGADELPYARAGEPGRASSRVGGAGSLTSRRRRHAAIQ